MFIPITLLCLLITVLVFRSSKSKYRNLKSPGISLPIIGHSYKLFSNDGIKDPTKTIWEIYKKYNRNGILYMNTFSIDSVWVGDLETLKYIFSHTSSIPRLNKNLVNLGLGPRKISGYEMTGVLLSAGDIWHQQRRFTLRTLRDFGFGKQGMEGMIKEEVSQFKQYIESNINEPMDFHQNLMLPILNALWKITVGERFDYDNARLLDINHRLSETFKIFGDPAQMIIAAYPWLLKIYPSLLRYDYILETVPYIIDLVEENIQKHKESLDKNAPRDFIDMMLIEIENTSDTKSSFYGQLGLDNLKVTLFDLFVAGSETTSTTLTWAALYMVRYPEVQKKVQEELDNVVGVNRSPSMTDKPNLPYTEAVLMEIQRHANIVPLGVPHISTKDIKVKDQIIPMNTVISPSK